MLTLLIAATAAAASPAPVTAIDAERTFAADAGRRGQWTAFRDWADPTAVMFEPQAVWVQQALKDRKDPARSATWAPAVSYVSCDGRTAVNTGAWRQPGTPAGGTFSTVWMRQKSGEWRWIVGSVDTAKGAGSAMPARARTVRSSCARKGAAAAAFAASAVSTEALAKPPGDAGQGRSADGTLTYRWIVSPAGNRRLSVRQWSGRAYRTVLDQRTAAPPRR
jgi:hypothetical protein